MRFSAPRVASGLTLRLAPAAAIGALGALVARHGAALRASGDAAHSSSPSSDAHASSISEVRVEAGKQYVHGRSEFKYEGSKKGGEVGARNEAAFIDYSITHPTWRSSPTAAYGMPHLINLLTVAPLAVGLTFAAAIFWGIFLWRLYAGTHFRSVIIARPAAA